VRARTTIAVAVVLVALLGACGSSKSNGSKNNSTTTVEQTTPTLPATTTTTSPPSPQQGTATPNTGLKDGDSVTVSVTGFTPVPKNPVGINECAQKGTASVDTPDCAIDHIVILKIKADGTGSATFKVLGANVGSAKHNCLDADTRCFLSIGELSADPKVERTDDVNLKFAG
jgi:hypothetical protein